MQKQLVGVGHAGASEAPIETNGLIAGELPNRRDPIRWLVGCGILLVAAIAVGTAIMTVSFRDRALESSGRELKNTVLLLARHFDQKFEDFEAAQNDIVAQVRLAGLISPDAFRREMFTYQTHLMLGRKVGGASGTVRLSIFDADGNLVSSSRAWPAPAVNVADRAYFKALQSDAASISRQIELVSSRLSGRPTTVIARKIAGLNGEFLGAVVQGVEPAEFETFFSSIATIALGKDAVISLHHRDGTLLARYPNVEPVASENFKADSAARAKLLNGALSAAQFTGPVDGQERLVSIQSLGGFPLSVVATATVASALAGWRAQTKFTVVVAVLFAAVIVGILILIIRHLSRQHQSSRLRLALEKRRLDTAVNNMSQGLILFDQFERLIVCNHRYIEMYGLSPEVAKPGCSLRDLIAHRNEVGSLQGDVDDHCFRILEHVSRSEGLIFSTPDGRSIQVTHRLVSDGGWVATHEDITERLRQETDVFEQATELARTNIRFDAALSNMSQGISMYDGERRLIVWNERFANIYQLSPALLKVGTHLNDVAEDLVARGILKGKTDHEAIRNKITAMDAIPPNSGSGRIEELSDGRLILISRQPMADGGWVATHEDITERRRTEAEIVHLARHDVLTGLANRAEFNAKLQETSKLLKDNGSAFAVMMLDLDKFKAVNDTLGHPAGDQLLVEVARRLKSSVRETDVLARLGGDEFAIILRDGPNQPQDAIALALRIISAIAQPFDLDGRQAKVGTSIGIVLAPEHGVEPEDLLKRADLALYDVKSGGRNDFRLFQSEMLDVADAQRSAESELRDAIANNELELHYQPVVDVKTRLPCGVEALVRWRHPTKGIIGPDQFIPLAESTGLVLQLGEWVLQRACADAVSWPAHIKVAVNISAVQFKKGNLFEVILCTLVEAGLSPERLELEITETALLENQEAHLATIRQLKNLGISLALDDFGTGFSSVSYLTVFPFDKIKIDKSFTQGVLGRRDCKAVVASTLALAQGLGIVTTAEGVETEAQLDYMRAAGVDLVQGYLLGRPVPISQLDLHHVILPREMVA